MQISELPAVKFLMISTIGYLIGNIFQFNQNALFVILSLAIIVFLFFSLIKKKQIAYYSTVILCGVYFSGLVSNSTIDTPNKQIPEFPAQFNGKIITILSESENKIKCIAQGNLDSKIFNNIKNSRIILNISIYKGKKKQISVSDRILAKVKARVPQKPVFPNDFDENRYAKSIDVQWICRANVRDIAIRSKEDDFNSINEKIVLSIKERLIKLFPVNTVGLATALITGDKTQIPTDVRNNFSYTGTAHLLAISGFHIGLIASIIFILIGFIKNRTLKFLIFIPLLVAFIFISGFQPSSIRAGVFIFFLMVTKQFERRIYPLNILALTVIMILLFNPQMVYSVGFQMSVLAVSGIFLLYQPILDFFKLFFKNQNLIIDYTIKTLALSLAASITVSPIVAYYFNIFSIIQPVSNFFVVPIISFGMMFTLLALAVSYISFPFAMLYSNSADFLFSLAQQLNEFAVKFNFSYIKNDNVFAISLVISLILIYIFLSNKKQLALFRTTAVIIALICFLNILNKNKSTEPTIYPLENYTVAYIPLSQNEDCILIVDRKPRLLPVKNFNVLNFIRSKRGEILLGYSGNIGINYSDYYKNIERIKSLPLSLEIQRRIAKTIFNKNYLHKEIRINYD
ncbi:MAG TPA: ComEC/Rec2 family competence protein [Candidatus Kapabacteria bacterium]|nr:ComEC/Rec2 family competence protein [Candidatus Kapabacteria bacterium]HPO63610.1 ComEC/Rec2 family competence protein [Candidatus Kapabacteria bacterium]